MEKTPSKGHGILPPHVFSGNNYEIGVQHGKAMDLNIKKSWALYTDKLNPEQERFDRPFFKKWGLAYLDVIKEFSHDYYDEIRGIAAGANMEPWEISTLNARTEIFLRINHSRLSSQPSECTCLYMPKAGILGQNWDWMSPCEALMALVEIDNKKEGIPKILTLIEPGMLGKIGFNSSGIGICINILLGLTPPEVGVPIHILFRKLLEANSLEEARQTLESVQIGSYSNILIGDSDGNFMDWECYDRQLVELRHDTAEIPVHTNHFVTDKWPAETCPPEVFDIAKMDVYYDNSVTRRNVALSIIERNESTESVDAMKTILFDQSATADPICKEYDDLWGVQHGTICTLIMDLAAGRLHFTNGNPITEQFALTTYQLTP